MIDVRSHLLAGGDMRISTLVTVRPGEALALTFGDVRERTVLVEQSVSLGEVKETTTGRCGRCGSYLRWPRT